jgi:hypothetical protein
MLTHRTLNMLCKRSVKKLSENQSRLVVTFRTAIKSNCYHGLFHVSTSHLQVNACKCAVTLKAVCQKTFYIFQKITFVCMSNRRDGNVFVLSVYL